MLDVESLTIIRKERRLLDDVSLHLGRGKILSLLGPSGSGKTTLMRLIMGLERPTSGTISIDGRLMSGNGAHLPPEKREAVMMFQEFDLFPHLDVVGNLTFGIRNAPDNQIVMEELLDALHIRQLLGKRIDNLSGGEQQRIVIARSLLIRPKLLLMDEPFSNIDFALKEKYFEAFISFLNRHEITTVIATHDIQEGFFLGDEVLILKDGVAVANGTPETLYSDPPSAWTANFSGPVTVATRELLNKLGADTINKNSDLFAFRPEALSLEHGEHANAIAGTVLRVDFYGFYRDIVVGISGERILVRVTGACRARVGDTVRVRLSEPDDFRLLPLDRSVTPGESDGTVF